MRLFHKEYSHSGFAKMDELALKGEPFLFIIDFDGNCDVYPLSNIPDFIKYRIHHHASQGVAKTLTYILPSYESYKDAFLKVQEYLHSGHSYLVNLTFRSKILTGIKLEEIYDMAAAPYVLLIKNKFISFSPETFVQIKGQQIYTYPMKGTISAAIPGAREILLGDEKEKAEHYTIVDLLRNDLSIVAADVRVSSFRHVSTIRSANMELLQTSSTINGTLKKDYINHPGKILQRLLPAGSVTGAPKKRTVSIIKEIEPIARGYYCGVWGIYENGNMDSAVLIRLIEQENDYLYYRSGGGITIYSDVLKEYEELKQKIYIPY